MRVYAISDIHTDFEVNMQWIESLDNTKYKSDILILAGDVSDKLLVIEETLKKLSSKFYKVCYVPGNHDLWVRENPELNSIDKLNLIQSLCARLQIYTKPITIENKFTIIPLYSWYVLPNEGVKSLHLPQTRYDDIYKKWSDFYFTRWPILPQHQKHSDFLMELNKPILTTQWQKPIITFSHFLPRRELLFPTLDDFHNFKVGIQYPGIFNFSAVAGDARLQKYIDKLESIIHIYGHQHRNRCMKINDTLYISHCLGYPSERLYGKINNIQNGPRLVYEC